MPARSRSILNEQHARGVEPHVAAVGFQVEAAAATEARARAPRRASTVTGFDGLVGTRQVLRGAKPWWAERSVAGGKALWWTSGSGDED